ncbi:MAG TPA: ABC transporter substrate-binding protein, partial [Thermoanaerobaculia bacterium]|nr:ABC transporter substrate-binding protein [Thermoanaerobaculia bacterium]
IDATEWVGPYDDEKLGFHKVAKLYYYPGWWEPGPSLSFYVNRRQWERLPETYREVLRCASRDAARAMQTRYDAKNPPALERLLAAGVELRPFSREILDAARRAAQGILEENAARDAAFRHVYDRWKAFRDRSFRWFGTAELAYAEFSFIRPEPR